MKGRRRVDITIYDYGVGNLHSIAKALELGGAKVRVATDIGQVLDAGAVVLPGVGEFGAVMKAMGRRKGALARRLGDGVPALGVCIGLQVMFEASEESGAVGLGLMKGEVKRFRGVRLPHMGWNTAKVTATGKKDPLMKGMPAEAHFYFANSYAPAPVGGRRLATTRYGRSFPSVMRKGNAYGTQFHPEKSGAVGLRLVRNFVRFAEGCV